MSGDHDAEEHEGSGEIKKEPGDPDIEEGQDELQSDGFKWDYLHCINYKV